MKKTFQFLLVSLVLALTLPSCEQSASVDDYPIMEQYYTESVNLVTATLDSVNSFKAKVDGFVIRNPEAKNHRRYSMIQENVKAASLRITINIDPAWAGEDSIRF